MTEGLSNVKLHLVDSVEKAQEFVAWAAERRPHNAVSVDIETGEYPGTDKKGALSPWHGDIRLAQVGDGQQGWAIPWDQWKGVYYQVMNKYDGPIVCHNIAFEAKWFAVKSEWELPWHQAHDTMLMAQVIDPLGPAALKQLAARYVDSRSVALQDTLDHQFSDNGWTWGTVPTSFEPYWCVPHSTEILTKRGWMTHSELLPSDETLGYDKSSGKNQWTKITNVTRFKDAPLVRVGTQHWSTVCTPDHRWLYQNPKYKDGKYDGYGDVNIAPLSEIKDRKSTRLFLSAEAEGGSSLITPNEAAILAWILSDGTVHWQRESSSPIASITQHPKKYVNEIRDLLKAEVAYVSERTMEASGCLSFYVRSGYVTDLWNKANLWEQSYSDLVLTLTSEARKAWWQAWLQAEGTIDKKNGGFTAITQNYGPKFDAIALTAYLEGIQVRSYDHDRNSTWGVIPLGSRGTTFQKSSTADAGIGDVWCPTTELGSWTARDVDGHIFVTGNCYGALDTVLTMRLWEQFYEKCGPGKPYSIPYELEMAARKITTRMEINGARIDLEYSQKKLDELTQYTEGVKKWAKDTYNGTSITSNVQLIRTFEGMGAVITETTPSGQKSMTKEQLEILNRDGSNEVRVLADAVLKQRKADKLASSYFSNFISDNINGFVHPSIRTMGARTGRMSITNPALQTLPSGDSTVRRAFIPKDEDHVLITSDLDQVEFRLTANFSGDQPLISLFNEADATGGDVFTSIMQQVYQDPTLVKADPRRKLIKGCVPLSTEILTKRGWLSHAEVVAGDETIGYNLETGVSEWTKVLGVHVFDDADIYKLSNGHRSFFCTDDHRWIADNGRSGTRGNSAKIIHANEFLGGEKRLILAAPAESGDLNISADESYLLGWILGDGGIKRSEFTGSPSQAGGRRVGCSIRIYQTKPDGILAIETALIGVPHKTMSVTSQGQHVWSLDADYARDLLGRAGIYDKDTFDPWELASGLSAPARERMIRGLDDADGKNKTPQGARTKIDLAIVQRDDSPVAELVVALGYLTGKFSRQTTYTSEIDNPNSWQKNPIKVVWHQKGTMTNQRASLEYSSTGSVWCVTTELGTWTMRQDHDSVPVLTGNTVYGKLYGAGVEKMALTAGVQTSQMKEVVDAFDRSYPGVKNLQHNIEEAGTRRLKEEGQGYVFTRTGRRLPCDDNRVYSLTNYLIQATAAEVFKQNLVRLDQADLTEMMVVPVHDEIVLQVPRDQAEDIKKVVGECMTTRDGWSVPLTAGVDGPFENWGSHYDDH